MLCLYFQNLFVLLGGYVDLAQESLECFLYQFNWHWQKIITRASFLPEYFYNLPFVLKLPVRNSSSASAFLVAVGQKSCLEISHVDPIELK